MGMQARKQRGSLYGMARRTGTRQSQQNERKPVVRARLTGATGAKPTADSSLVLGFQCARKLNQPGRHPTWDTVLQQCLMTCCALSSGCAGRGRPRSPADRRAVAMLSVVGAAELSLMFLTFENPDPCGEPHFNQKRVFTAGKNAAIMMLRLSNMFVFGRGCDTGTHTETSRLVGAVLLSNVVFQ